MTKDRLTDECLDPRAMQPAAHEHTHLQEVDHAAFFAALDSPSEPVEALASAAALYNSRSKAGGTCDLDDPVDYGSTVRNNLMKRPGYAPYCGETVCFNRTRWDGEQFRCSCGYRIGFPDDFLALYMARREAMLSAPDDRT